MNHSDCEQLLLNRTGRNYKVRMKREKHPYQASVNFLTKKITMDNRYWNAPEMAIEATLLHEAGHLRDGIFNAFAWTTIASALGMVITVLWWGTNNVYLGFLGIGVSLSFFRTFVLYDFFERRADRWAACHFSGGTDTYLPWKNWDIDPLVANRQ